ncbi:hypothetical protein V1279_003161 [Bradyrhizobium sp. AZCC 1610]
MALFHHGELVADVFAVRVWRVFGPEALLGPEAPRNILQKTHTKLRSGCELCSNLTEQRHAT